jgi:hypothetical protein
MSWRHWVASWLDWDDPGVVESIQLGFEAAWATSGHAAFWFVLGLLAVVALVVLFYGRLQSQLAPGWRWPLTFLRGMTFALLLITLAGPRLTVRSVEERPATLFLVVDGTASMQIRDYYDLAEQRRMADLTGLRADDATSETPSRMEYVRAWLRKTGESSLSDWQQRTGCQIRTFLFDGISASDLRELTSDEEGSGRFAGTQIAEELTANGQVTALGSALRQLAWQPGRQSLAAVMLISDFAQNSGEQPAGDVTDASASPAVSLGVPVFSIGVGSSMSRDLAVQLYTETKIRRGEETVVRIRVRPQGIVEEDVRLLLRGRSFAAGQEVSDWRQIDARSIRLGQEEQLVEVPFVPPWQGEVELEATVDVLKGEVVERNNRSSQRIQVIDDYVRVLYVAEKPTWEWRFIKEILHRDSAVGMRGFRTFLVSSDPRVRQGNPMFEPALASDRKSFFRHDVVILDDVSRATLTERFCDLLTEFVADLGGGLIVLAGPTHGVRGLVDTPLERLLPVFVEPDSALVDDQEFSPQRLPLARDFAFMQLADSESANETAWQKLDELPWYQPVAGVDQRAVVLAEHPTDECAGEHRKQPVIAVRRYGDGEVVYMAFNEMWRLRRGSGAEHYQRFWLPLIDRLALSHALGSEKRFIVRVERERYTIGDEVVVTVHAFNEDYEPISEKDLVGGKLPADLVRPQQNGETEVAQTLELDELQPGVFETRFPVLQSGRFEIQLRDPVTDSLHVRTIEVDGANAEFSYGTLDQSTQRAIAAASGGRDCHMSEVDDLLENVQLPVYRAVHHHNKPLWTSPFWFAFIIALMMGEWTIRRWKRLP